MWWPGKRAENLPWYRQPSKSGTVTETEMRVLDQYRLQERHPAARKEDLPLEVQAYISALEFDLYETKQRRLVSRTALTSALGAALLYLTHYGYQAETSRWDYFVGLALLVVPWFLYSRESRKNNREFMPEEANAPTSTNERLKEEWELTHVIRESRAGQIPEEPA